MRTKTANLKRPTISDSLPAKNGKAVSNGGSPKAAKRKKSIRERWIEKYGVDDSELARKTLEMWQMVYDAHNKPKS